MKKCSWCGRPITGKALGPSGFKAFYNHKLCDEQATWYCGKKCKQEAEAAEDGGSGEDRSSSGSSSSSDETALPSGCGTVLCIAVLLFLILVIIAMIFQKEPEDVNNKEQMMALWGEHLEKRCEAFAEGLSEEGVEARGLRNYTWDEWLEFKQNGQKKQVEQSGKSDDDEDDMFRTFQEYNDKWREMQSKNNLSDTDLEKMGFPVYTWDEWKALDAKKREDLVKQAHEPLVVEAVK